MYSAALALSVSPDDPAEFLSQCWERRPHLINRGVPTYFDLLFSLKDLDHIIAYSGLRYPAYRVVMNQRTLRPTETMPGKTPHRQITSAVMSRIYDSYAAGATLLLQGLEKRWSSLAAYSADLASTMAMPIQVNAYLTPPASQGFPVHYDTHDVLLLQILGCKRWKVWPAVIDNPVKTQKYNIPLDEVQTITSQLTPIIDADVAAGDTLYIPRGFPHVGFAGNSDSLHLTVGFFPHRVSDVVRAILFGVIDAASDERALRLSLTRAMRDPDIAHDELRTICQMLRERVRHVDVDSHLAKIVDERHVQ